ncbi:MAG: ComEA family DNA-binding protein [Peptoniphilus sp.]|nr:ComEA family DNA-binding protein [Peptoniphilus sp.]MDD7363696.1 ComEA family DNA-binding protein [Bacillota bacterium]MDY6044081.1 ComEA family DNA-binding protein [Peptoniphilus sp.]
MRFTDREKKLIFIFGAILVLTVAFMNSREGWRHKEDGVVALDGERSTDEGIKELEPSQESGDVVEGTIYVDIGGAVKNPGLYELDKGSRVKDGITAAGGTVGDADMSQINLAKKLNDEEKLYVPAAGEGAPQADGTAVSSAGGLVSIQNGSREELMRLPGIGEKTADKIIEYRSEHPFSRVEDLKEVPGIGDKTFESLKSNIQL